MYTLRTAEALEDCATAHWPRHIDSLRTFDVTTHGIWTDHDADSHRPVALIPYPEAADPASVTAAYMAGPHFYEVELRRGSGRLAEQAQLGTTPRVA